MHSWIDSHPELAELAERLLSLPRIGFDTEFMRVRTYWPELALLQSTDTGPVALVDPVAIGDLSPLKPVFVSADTVKLMHSASEDLVALAPICAGEPIGALFDTQVAAAFAGLGAGLGYQRLIAALLGVELDKGETRSNWLARPLTVSQLAYAEADVIHLPAVHDALLEKLEARKLRAWCEEECDRLARAAASGETDDSPHHEFKSLWKWPLERQIKLKRLLDWREATAREVNRPRLWIFDNPAAVTLLDAPLHAPGELATRLATQKAFPKRLTGALFDLINEPIGEDEAGIAPIPAPMRGEDEKRFDEVRNRIAERAAELDLPPALLGSRRQTEALLRGGTPPSSFRGWRREALGGVLDDLVPSFAKTGG
jgi:ribonuclease D